MVKIIHCADLHLDSKMTANLSNEKAKERKIELLSTFKRMVDYADNNDVSAIIIAGDMFDIKNISATAKNAVLDTINTHADITFYYLKGNHDAESLVLDQEIVPDNLKLFGDKWTSYTIEGTSNVVITGVELGKENRNSVYTSLTLDNDKFNIVTLHGQESVNALSSKASEKEEIILIKELKNKGIDYLALGHVHTPKMETLDARGKYCYAGCLEGRGFDECGEHGFMLLSIDEKKHKYQADFIPFASRNLYELVVDITGCMTTSEIEVNVKKAFVESGYDERSLIKVILQGDVDVECEKNIDFLVKQFENDFYFIKIYDETKLKVDYNAFALDESLKGEFVRKVLSAKDIDEEDKATIIRYGIQVLAGEEIQ